MNWDILDPRSIIRLWTADGMDWNEGRFKSFWLKSNALKQCDEFKKKYLFVTLIDEWTGERYKLKDNPNKEYHIVQTDKGEYFIINRRVGASRIKFHVKHE